MPMLSTLFIAATLALSPAVSSAHAADSDGWRTQLDAEVAQALQQDPDAASAVDDILVVRTRARTLHVAAPDSPYTQVLIAERLLDGADEPEVRLALATALTARGHEHPQLAAGLVDVEQDPAVKAVLLHGLRRVDAELAIPRLERALADADYRVRLEAAVVAGDHADGAQLADALVVALADSAPAVRGRAARALGRHEVSGAWEALQTSLTDDEATVRLQALRALQHIDEARLQALPQLGDLVDDADAKVARAAERLAR